MSLYPGATYKPTSHGGRVKRNRQGRAILHVAVNRHQELAPWDANTWHFYVGLTAPDGSTDGSGGPAVCTQYVDTDFCAWASVDANDDALSVETAGGTGSSRELNAEPWNQAQRLRIIDLMRWEAKQPGGAPLAVLPDSKPGRQGWGPHRLGIKHSAGQVPGWWAPGGEVWSSALGKECPGDAKVAQVPGLVTEARTDAAPVQAPKMEDDDVAYLIRREAGPQKGAVMFIDGEKAFPVTPAAYDNLGARHGAAVNMDDAMFDRILKGKQVVR